MLCGSNPSRSRGIKRAADPDLYQFTVPVVAEIYVSRLLNPAPTGRFQRQVEHRVQQRGQGEVPDRHGPDGFCRGAAENLQRQVEIKDGLVVIVYQDGRVERWTPVGKRMVVEHWHPGAPFPSGTPVLGIADGAR